MSLVFGCVRCVAVMKRVVLVERSVLVKSVSAWVECEGEGGGCVRCVALLQRVVLVERSVSMRVCIRRSYLDSELANTKEGAIFAPHYHLPSSMPHPLSSLHLTSIDHQT